MKEACYRYGFPTRRYNNRVENFKERVVDSRIENGSRPGSSTFWKLKSKKGGFTGKSPI